MPGLQSFGQGLTVAVVGASGGIGAAVTRQLCEDQAVDTVFGFSRQTLQSAHPKLSAHALDMLDEDSVSGAAAMAAGKLDLVFVATGLLHDEDAGLQPEKTWRSLNAEALARVYAVNAIGPALVAKHFLPVLARDKKAVFAAISARVGSISDNGLGGWHAYRAAKAALNQLLKTLSIELARKNPSALCVGLHPGTVDTGLSKPFQRGVADGKLFTPDYSARSMLSVLDGLTPADSGGLFAWDGQRIPF